MRTKKIVVAFMAAALVLGALALVGCSGGGNKSITGEWKMDNSDTTYVITDTAITAPSGEIPYKLEKDGKILLFAGESQESEAKYELSDDGKTLTIIETFNAGGSSEASGTPQEIKTVFKKVSDNKDAKPSAGTGTGDAGANGGTDAGTDTSK